MRKSSLLALMVLVSATGLSAKDKDNSDDSNTSAQDQKDAPKKKKLICRTENTTGSRVQVRRICHTPEEWDQIADQTRADLRERERYQSRALPGQNPLGGGNPYDPTGQ